MIILKKISLQFVKWLIGFGFIADGLLNIVTLGLWPDKLQPKFSLKLATLYSVVRFRFTNDEGRIA